MVKINLSILVFCPTIFLATLKVYTKFEDFGSHRCWEIWQKFLLERKKNGQIKVMISRRRLFLSYTIQVIPNICTKFQNPWLSSSWEIFDKNNFTHKPSHIVTEKTKTIYPLYTSYTGGITNLLQVDSEDSTETGWMPRLIWVFAGRTGHFFCFVVFAHAIKPSSTCSPSILLQ